MRLITNLSSPFLAFCLVFSTYILSAQNVTIGNTTLVPRDIATGLQVPWEVLWGPDDHLWVTERRGNILRINPETGNTTTVLNHVSSVRQASESGMLGMVLHPDFPDSAFVYVVYTYGSGNTFKEKLSRFRFNGTNLVQETVILDNLQAGNIHNGSRLVITPDRKLFMTVGDVGTSSNSQNLNTLSGKILRMELDGTIPADNPIPGSRIYSFGHRNPQGLHFGENGILYSSEHGQSNSDEVNIIEPNRNYGWPNVEGRCNTANEMTFCTNNNVREPLTEFSPCLAVNDLIYYNHPAIPELQNSLLMAVLGGFSNNVPQIRHLKLAADGRTIVSEKDYFKGFGRLRDICVNPHTGALIFATNGSSYPGFGPNRIIEYSNPQYVSNNEPRLETINSVRVQPNPVMAPNQPIFSVSESFLGAPFEIFSFNGDLVQKGQVSGLNFSPNTENTLPAGSYFIRITNELGTVTRVFVVQ